MDKISYSDLLNLYNNLKNKYEKVIDERNQLLNKLENKESIIKNELDPRVKQEETSYDLWLSIPENFVDEVVSVFEYDKDGNKNYSDDVIELYEDGEGGKAVNKEEFLDLIRKNLTSN